MNDMFKDRINLVKNKLEALDLDALVVLSSDGHLIVYHGWSYVDLTGKEQQIEHATYSDIKKFNSQYFEY